MFRRIAASTLLALTIAACGVVSDPIDAIDGLAVSPDSVTLAVGGTEQLTATATGVVGSPDTSVTWSSDDEAVATVSDTGLVEGVAEGTATITATSVFDDTITATAEITVQLEDVIGGLDVAPATATLAIAATVPLTATPTDVFGSPDTSVTWSSGDEAVATVDAATGVVTAVDAGTATITATSTFDATVTGTAEITVAQPLTGANYLLDTTAGTLIDPALEADLAGGAAPFTFALSDTYEADPTLELNGLPPGVTLDSASGQISGTPTTANYYRAVIEVTDAADQTIKILAEIDVELVFSYDSATYFYGPDETGVIVPDTEINLIGSTGPDNYTMSLISQEGDQSGVASDWSINELTGAITRVTAPTSGVTSWTYTVTVVDTGGSKTATFDVTLTEEQIGGLDVTPATATVTVDGTQQLTVEATGVVGSPDTSVTWSSDATGVATVDADGLVTAVAAGTANITATSNFDPSVSDTAVITVE